MKALEQKEGITLKIEQDDDAVNPRTEFDEFGKMVCWHKRYDLGDKHEFDSPEEFHEWWKENGRGGEILSLYLYDHSGITMRTSSFGDPWDSGQVGYIYATAEMIRKEYGKRITKAVRKKVREVLNAEVETYDMYLTGDVWGYVIENEEGEHLDSCWGFYGRKYCEEQAREEFNHYVEKARAERLAIESANETVNDLTA